MTAVGGSAAYIAWAGIILTHLRVRGGLERQGVDGATYPFRAAGSIWIYRLNLFMNVFILCSSRASPPSRVPSTGAPSSPRTS